MACFGIALPPGLGPEHVGWLLFDLAAGGAVAGAMVAVCSIFGKAIGSVQRIDLSWKLIEESQ